MRNYIVASWNDADQYDYSGEMLGGSRHQGRSQKVHFNPDGSACVASYADAVEEKKPTKVPLKQRILPQSARLDKLTAEIIELEEGYRKGEFDIDEYSMLRAVAFKKRSRAQELLKKAVSVKKTELTPSNDEDSKHYDEHNAEDSGENAAQNGVSDESVPMWLQQVKESNSLKTPLIKACRAWKKAVQLSQAARNYYLTLKAL